MLDLRKQESNVTILIREVDDIYPNHYQSN